MFGASAFAAAPFAAAGTSIYAVTVAEQANGVGTFTPQITFAATQTASAQVSAVQAAAAAYVATLAASAQADSAQAVQANFVSSQSESTTAIADVNGGALVLATVDTQATATSETNSFLGRFSYIEETVYVSAAQAAQVAFLAAQNESASMHDELSGEVPHFVDVAETSTGADAFTGFNNTNAALTAGVLAQDSISRQANFAASMIEYASATEGYEKQVAFVSIVSAGVSASAASANTATFSAVIDSAARASEVASVIATMFATVTENVAATGSQASSAVFVTSVAEAASAAATMLRGLVIPVALTSSATAAATPAGTVLFAANMAEQVSATALASAIKTVTANVTGVQLYVQIGGTLVWAVIDDSQNPNWQNIVNAQTSGWTTIVDAQTPGWVILPS